MTRDEELEALRAELKNRSRAPARFSVDPDDVQRSVVRLVLSLVELLRRLLERQALRRMDADTLDAGEIERVGRALMQLEQTVNDLAARFGIEPSQLNLDLGPLGRLL